MVTVPTEGGRQWLPWCVFSNPFCSSCQHEGVWQGATNADIRNNRNGHAFKGAFENSVLTIWRVSIIFIYFFSNFLFVIYSSKCNKFAVGKKSAIGDKTATRRHEHPISWNRLPFATTPLLTSADADVQRTRVWEFFFLINTWDNKWYVVHWNLEWGRIDRRTRRRRIFLDLWTSSPPFRSFIFPFLQVFYELLLLRCCSILQSFLMERYVFSLMPIHNCVCVVH